MLEQIGRVRLEPLAQGAQEPLRGALEQRPGLRAALRGQWLDHPLHAALTDVPVGAFVASSMLDGVSAAADDASLQRGADALLAIGVVGAVVAALPGAADWAYTSGAPRRIGVLHALANTAASGLYAASLLARRRGRRPLGVALCGAGLGLLLCGTWLGGELTYRLGVGVADRRAAAGEGI